MKLYTMKCIKDPERMDECFEPDNQEKTFFVKLEDDWERGVYEATHCNYNDLEAQFWDYYMNDILGMNDDEVRFYFMEDDPAPAIGEEYIDADGLVWERVE